MTDSPETPRHQARSYDKRLEITQAIRLLEALSPSVQSLIADTLVALVHKECGVTQADVDAFAVSQQGVEKRRAYDQNPTFQNAMNHLYILPDDCLDGIGNAILSLLDLIYEYFDQVKTTGKNIDEAALKKLTDTYIQQGLEAAVACLKSL